MKKSQKRNPTSHGETVHFGFTPSQEQINALARRLAPEIKKLFADEQIRHEFEKWRLNQDSAD